LMITAQLGFRGQLGGDHQQCRRAGDSAGMRVCQGRAAVCGGCCVQGWRGLGHSEGGRYWRRDSCRRRGGDRRFGRGLAKGCRVDVMYDRGIHILVSPGRLESP